MVAADSRASMGGYICELFFSAVHFSGPFCLTNGPNSVILISVIFNRLILVKNTLKSCLHVMVTMCLL